MWAGCGFYIWGQFDDGVGLNALALEMSVFLALTLFLSLFYFVWLRKTFWRELNLFDDHMEIAQTKSKIEKYEFKEIRKIATWPGSLFKIHFNDGRSIVLGSMIERSDYIWERLFEARPDLIQKEKFNSKRTKIIQYDHHQKRREFFWKHRGLDFLHWAFLPVLFVGLSFIIQTQQIEIHQPTVYFFRLAMISILVVIMSAFIFSFTLKKMVFDPRLRKQLINNSDYKLRDTSFEKSVWSKTKVWQFAFSVLLFAYVLKNDLNLYSITKIKHDVSVANHKKGETVVVDNRYNCVNCNFKVQEGDIIVFAKGYIGEVLAIEGEKIAYISGGNSESRSIASSVPSYEIPPRHIAVKTGKSEEPIVIVKVDELIGKVKK